MKRVAAILLFTLAGFKANEEKKLTVSLTLQEWQAVLNVIDQSNAPHLQVQQVQNLLIPALNKQIDTTKGK